MALVFLDTSSLLKLYVPEIGTTWLKTLVTSNQVVISELALFESATALRRRYLEGTYTREQASDLYAQLNKDSVSYEIIPLGGELQLNRVVDMAFTLAVGLRIRALDAIHLAAANHALDASNNQVPPVPFTFVCSDLQLLRVAQALGFPTENPEDYP